MWGHSKDIKRSSKWKWNDNEYHAQYNADVYHSIVKNIFNSTQFTTLPFCGTHIKLHGVHGLSKHYHFHLDAKLGQVICAIQQILCACLFCAAMLDKLWSPGVLHTEQPQYQPVLVCKRWPVFRSFNNRNIIKFVNKSTPSEDFDDNHRIFLDGISYNMDSL